MELEEGFFFLFLETKKSLFKMDVSLLLLSSESWKRVWGSGSLGSIDSVIVGKIEELVEILVSLLE